MTNTIRINLPISFTFIDYLDNESIAMLVYIMGCEHNCSGCFNPQFQNYNYENSFEINFDGFLNRLKLASNKHHTNKVVLTGGDPLAKNNIEFTKKLILEKDYDFTIYTGHNISYVKKNKVTGFNFIKCGKYQKQNKQSFIKTHRYIRLASSNQKIYDFNYKLLSDKGIYEFNRGSI